MRAVWPRSRLTGERFVIAQPEPIIPERFVEVGRIRAISKHLPPRLSSLQAWSFPCPGHLAQLHQSHLKTRPGDIGKVQIELFGQSSKLPVHADWYPKSIRQSPLLFGGSQEFGERVIVKICGLCSGHRFPDFCRAYLRPSLQRRGNLH